jgi:serine/threonine-protein phosphatase 6 regulatory ankyrin repeat subunit B
MGPFTVRAEPIHEAARDGNAAKVKELLEKDPALARAVEQQRGKDQSTDGFTPLHYAARGGNKEVAELLLTGKADVNAQSHYGGTPLHQAVGITPHWFVRLEKRPWRWAEDERRKAVAELLLAHHADVNAKDWEGRTPLHHAAATGQKGMVELLLANKADRKALDRESLTPLHEAVWSGHNEVVELLLAKGNDLDTLSACGLGKTDRVKEFLKKDVALVNAQDGEGRTLLHWAAATDQKAVAELLLTHQARSGPKTNWGGFTPLHLAAVGGHKAVAESLLEQKEDVDATDQNGWTPLHRAVKSGHKAVVELLLAHGADVKAQTRDYVYLGLGGSPGPPNATALHLAAANGDEGLVQLLLSYKADINARDAKGKTPLRAAIVNQHTTVADLLRQKGGKE